MWKDAYQRLVTSDFGEWPPITIPFVREHMTEERGLTSERYQKCYKELEVAGKVRVSTYVKKNDRYVFVYFCIGSYESSYDEDGYGGGTTDEYAFGVIDPQGRWAFPLKYCMDTDLTDLYELDPADYLPEEQRQEVWSDGDAFSIL